MNVIQMRGDEVRYYFDALVRLKCRSMAHSFQGYEQEKIEAFCRQKVSELPGYMEKGMAYVFAALADDGTLAGFLWSYPRNFFEEKRLFINGIAVSEPFEGRGIARRMMQALFTFAKENGYGAVDLTVAPFNQRAVGFYHGLGFEDERIQMVLKLKENG